METKFALYSKTVLAALVGVVVQAWNIFTSGVNPDVTDITTLLALILAIIFRYVGHLPLSLKPTTNVQNILK